MTKSLPKKHAVFLIAVLQFFFISCNSNEPCKECSKCGENLEYGNASSLSISPRVDVESDTMVVVDDAFVENKIKIEKKFGEQWDFCKCVLANDSLDKLIKNNAELDEEFMAEFEEVDQKCKAFLVMSPNKTPEERMEHERKIRKCLKAGKR